MRLTKRFNSKNIQGSGSYLELRYPTHLEKNNYLAAIAEFAGGDNLPVNELLEREQALVDISLDFFNQLLLGHNWTISPEKPITFDRDNLTTLEINFILECVRDIVSPDQEKN